MFKATKVILESKATQKVGIVFATEKVLLFFLFIANENIRGCLRP